MPCAGRLRPAPSCHAYGVDLVCRFHRAAWPLVLLLLPTRDQNGMSSSAELPTGAAACWKSPVSAGTSLLGVKRPPFSPPSRDPRNWTESAMISMDWRLLPSLSCHSRHSSRPSTATGRPFWRYVAQFSPCAPHTVTSKKLGLSTHSPEASLRRVLTATRRPHTD